MKQFLALIVVVGYLTTGTYSAFFDKKQKTLKEICEFLSPESLEDRNDCNNFLHDSFVLFGQDLYAIAEASKNQKLAYLELKQFFIDVVNVELFKCNAECVLYLKDCIGLKQIQDWVRVLQFANWPFLWRITDMADSTKSNLCNNIVDISKDPESKVFLEFYLSYLGDFEAYPKCNFLQIKALEEHSKDIRLWGDLASTEKRESAVMKKYFINVFYYVHENDWKADQIIAVTKEVAEGTPIKFTPDFRRKTISLIFRSLKHNKNFKVADLIPVLEKCEDEKSLNFAIESLGLILKKNIPGSHLKDIVAIAEYKMEAVDNLVACMCKVQASYNSPGLFESNFRAIYQVSRYFDDDQSLNNVSNLCYILKKVWHVDSSLLFFDIMVTSINNGFSITQTLEFFNYSVSIFSKDFEKTGVFTRVHLKKVALLQYVLKKNQVMDQMMELKDRKVKTKDLENVYHGDSTVNSRALRFFFSDKFRNVGNYQKCPFRVVLSTASHYDQSCTLSDDLFMEVVDLRCRMDTHNDPLNWKKYFQKFPIEDEIMKLIRRAGLIGTTNQNNERAISVKLNYFLTIYDPFMTLIMLKRFQGEKLQQFFDFVNKTTFSDRTVLNLTTRFDIDFLHINFTKSSFPLFPEIVGPILTKLTDEEIRALPELLELVGKNIVPTGLWTDDEISDWLYFMHVEKIPDLGLKFLSKNPNCPIKLLMENLLINRADDERMAILLGSQEYSYDCPYAVRFINQKEK